MRLLRLEDLLGYFLGLSHRLRIITAPFLLLVFSARFVPSIPLYRKLLV